MHYIFLDESYSSGNGQKTIIMAAWIVEQARYNRFFSTSPDLYRTPEPVHKQIYATLQIPMEVMKPVKTWHETST